MNIFVCVSPPLRNSFSAILFSLSLVSLSFFLTLSHSCPLLGSARNLTKSSVVCVCFCFFVYNNIFSDFITSLLPIMQNFRVFNSVSYSFYPLCYAFDHVKKYRSSICPLPPSFCPPQLEGVTTKTGRPDPAFCASRPLRLAACERPRNIRVCLP